MVYEFVVIVQTKGIINKNRCSLHIKYIQPSLFTEQILLLLLHTRFDSYPIIFLAHKMSLLFSYKLFSFQFQLVRAISFIIILIHSLLRFLVFRRSVYGNIRESLFSFLVDCCLDSIVHDPRDRVIRFQRFGCARRSQRHGCFHFINITYQGRLKVL